ncbi:unnamed protein product [Closterium sp. NIES-64]|nr:unnamed protein product [Closterium sp. NIES-64]
MAQIPHFQPPQHPTNPPSPNHPVSLPPRAHNLSPPCLPSPALAHQPMCDQKKPQCSGLCASSAVSAVLTWGHGGKGAGGTEAKGQGAGGQGGREAGGQGGREAGRQGGRGTGGQGGREAGAQRGREAGAQRGREAGAQRGREAGAQRGREAGARCDRSVHVLSALFMLAVIPVLLKAVLEKAVVVTNRGGTPVRHVARYL